MASLTKVTDNRRRKRDEKHAKKRAKKADSLRTKTAKKKNVIAIN